MNNNPLYRKNKTNKRRTTPNTKLQTLAQKENFALYLLKGRSTHFLNGIVPTKVTAGIEFYQKQAILHIKQTQQERMQKRKRK